MSDESKEAGADRQPDAPGVGRRDFLVGAAGGAVIGGAGAGLGVWGAHRLSQAGPKGAEVNPRLFSFVGGKAGPWSVVEARAVVGDPLPTAARLEVVSGIPPATPDGVAWHLRGVTSNARYTTRAEKEQLAAKQVDPGRAGATRAALIPIRKNATWWGLSQAERRAIFEDRSHHTQVGLKYLPAVARRLHHCRDLGESEPFDFLTWFDYAEADASAFDDLVAELRASEEWKYVEREVDIRLVRDGEHP